MIFQWPPAFWVKHGTKVIGYGSAAIGALEFVDAKTIQIVEHTLGPKYGPPVSSGIQITSGLLTAYRGHVNSQRVP